LQALDIGYGYAADGGKSYPFRGRVMLEQGRGAVPGRNRFRIGEWAGSFDPARFIWPATI